MTTLVPSFLDKSSSLLQVTRVRGPDKLSFQLGSFPTRFLSIVFFQKPEGTVCIPAYETLSALIVLV